MHSGLSISLAGLPTLTEPVPEPDDGVFETFLVVNGRPRELIPHLARLRSSLDTLFGAALPPGTAERLEQTGAGVALARMRITVTPGQEDEPPISIKAVDESILFPPVQRGLAMEPVVVPGGIGAHKWADRRLLARAEAGTAPALPLLVDVDGTLLEGSRSCLFIVRDGALSTPGADKRILPGTTRARVIKVARGLGLEVREEGLAFDRLAEADEVFMTGAVRGVEHVRSCAGVREWSDAPVSARVSAALRELWFEMRTRPYHG